MIKVIADQNLYQLEKFLPKEIDLKLYNPIQGIPDISGVDALLLRTASKLNAQTFPDLPPSLKFVGTGSSGSDHVDSDYLSSHNIKFVDALGCNARAVAEYVMTSLLLWSQEKSIDLKEFTYGIIGVGKAGTAVTKIFDSFELNYVLYDPPRAKKDSDFSSATINEVLDCDVLTFHVPISECGQHPTFHWLDEEKLSSRSFKLIINASRGGVIDEKAVSKAMASDSIKDIIIDVWEYEPDFNSEFAERAFIATPHIAGYSEQAKLNASKIICEKLCSFFGLSFPSINNLYPDKEIKPALLNYTFDEVLTRLHPIKEYDADLRDLVNRPDKATLFSKLRTDRPFRYEYEYLRLEEKILNEFRELRRLRVKNS